MCMPIAPRNSPLPHPPPQPSFRVVVWICGSITSVPARIAGLCFRDIRVSEVQKAQTHGTKKLRTKWRSCSSRSGTSFWCVHKLQLAAGVLNNVQSCFALAAYKESEVVLATWIHCGPLLMSYLCAICGQERGWTPKVFFAPLDPPGRGGIDQAHFELC
jgi:hypothetical protein